MLGETQPTIAENAPEQSRPTNSNDQDQAMPDADVRQLQLQFCPSFLSFSLGLEYCRMRSTLLSYLRATANGSLPNSITTAMFPYHSTTAFLEPCSTTSGAKSIYG